MMNKKSNQGFSLVEIILAIALFGLFATALIGLLMISYGSNYQAEEKSKAVLLAQEGLDAALSIRRQAWNLLVNGVYGLDNSVDYWQFSGSSQLIDDRFTRTITIADGCRDGSENIVDCSDVGATVDINTKKITSLVAYTSINAVTNSVELISYATNWQSANWVQTDWVGGDSQAIWSSPTAYDSDDGNVEVSASGQVTLATVGTGGGCGDFNWPFTSSGDYTFNSSDIEVIGGVAQLISGGDGSPASGDTLNSGFNSDASSWSYSDWEGAGSNVSGAYQGSLGNPGGRVAISINKSKNTTLSGFYEQAFTTTIDNPSVATTTLNWQITQYSASFMSSFILYAYVESTPGAPVNVNDYVWTSGNQTGVTSWNNVSEINIASRLGTAGTYYLKIAARVITTGGGGAASGTNIASFDNVALHWEGIGIGGYPTDQPSINPTITHDVNDLGVWSSFTETATKNGGEIYYQISDDGSSWYYWTGTDWNLASVCDGTTQNCNIASAINLAIQSFPTSTAEISFRAFFDSNGAQQIELDNIQVSCAQNYDWNFNIDTEYNYNFSDVEVTAGQAQLVSSSGSPTSGSTTNPNFSSNEAGWTYFDWTSENTSNVANGTWQSSGGNPGGYVNISIPRSRNIRSGGYWQQAFTTTVDNPTVTLDLDWIASQYQSGATDFGMYVYVDSFSGNPIYGQEVLIYEGLTSTTSWTSELDIDVSSRVTTAGTYYLKVAGWVDIPSGTNRGPYTIGYDNVQLSWIGPGSSSYPTTQPSINPNNSLSVSGLDVWSTFTETATKNGGEIYYQLSDNNGATWLYWNGAAWSPATACDGVTQHCVTASGVNTNITAFPTTTAQISFRAFLDSNGAQQVILDNVQIGWGEGGGGSGYATAGYLLSSAFNTGVSSSFNLLSWSQIVPSCTPACAIQLQVRSAPDASGSPGTWSDWHGNSGSGSYFTNNNETLLPTVLNFNQWVQYRVELAGDGNDTPIFEDININYTP